MFKIEYSVDIKSELMDAISRGEAITKFKEKFPEAWIIAVSDENMDSLDLDQSLGLEAE